MSNVKEKLTDQQLRIIQLVAGIISGAALIIALFIAGPMAGDNVALQYLWLIVFVVVMFGRRWIERKYRLRLLFYNLVLVDTLAISIIIYLAVTFFSPAFSAQQILPSWPEWAKLLILIVPGIAIIILGIIMPLRRYNKRKEEGTLRPIRLPEPEEAEETEEEAHVDNGPMTIEQQAEAMRKELDGNRKQNEE